METVSHDWIIGIDVSRDWLDIHCLSDGQRLRLPNTAAGHARLVELAKPVCALVCFEATGGQEWRLRSALDAAEIATRQLPPAQIKAFAVSRGTRAKTDRIDAELITRFMAFRPDAGRKLPHEKIRLLRALASKRGQLVETRKRLLAQVKAHGKPGSADMFEAMDSELKDLLDRQITELEVQIEEIITTDESLARTAGILRSVPGIGPVASTMLIAEMPELGHITGEQAAALTGLAPIAHDRERCVASAQLAVAADCYGMSCSRLPSSPAITIRFSNASLTVSALLENPTKLSSLPLLESSSQSSTHFARSVRNGPLS